MMEITEQDILNVWHGQIRVGKLWKNIAGVIGFQYDEHWIENGFAISQQLPLDESQNLPDSGKAHQFFVNLLPEADARLHIIRDLKVANSDFELLKVLGGECAGALSILPVGQKPSDESKYQLMGYDELTKLILRRGQIYAVTSKADRPRLSLAGAQDKCPVYYDGNDYYLPKDTAPSSHILKFELADYRNIPVYEYFTTQLAKAIDLPVINMNLCKHEKHYYLLIERYDRIFDKENAIQRLHQEDFCQALGYGYEKKYQESNGPTFHDCYKLLQMISVNPIKDTEMLLHWQIFNLLAGNSDAHAKNISLVYHDGNQAELAPFYDLVCTRAIKGIDVNLAFSIGNEYNPNKIQKRHWESFASDCAISQNYLFSLVQEMAENMLEKLPGVKNEFEATYEPYPALQRVHQVITKQCNRILKSIA